VKMKSEYEKIIFLTNGIYRIAGKEIKNKILINDEIKKYCEVA